VFESRQRGTTFVRGTDRWLLLAGVGALVLGLVLRLLTDIGRSTAVAERVDTLPPLAAPAPASVPPTTAETLAATGRPATPDAPPVAGTDSAVPTAAPAEATADRPAPSRPTAPPPTKGVAPAGTWSVQLGTFGQQPNADRLRAQVEALGYAVTLEPIARDSGAMYRVRAVGFGNRDEAQRAADKIASATGTRGVVAAVR
jgi:cell division septation protein DedD